jgi:hypothetical protein
MGNPFNKYLGKEDKFQHAVMRLIKFQYPDYLVTHASNEGKRTPFERFKLKYLGTKAGIPDILIFTPNKKYNGLAIELKVNYNKPTESQLEWLDKLKKCNWYACWSKSFEEVEELLQKYYNNEL